jgi:HK97 family phage prohead protease
MKSTLDIRSLRVELRAAANFVLEGVAISYDTPSAPIGGKAGFIETIKAGAFTRSLASGADVKCLVNHDPNRVLGRRKNSTLTLSDSPTGLSFCCQLNKRNSAHSDLYSSVARGDMDECSFAFNATKQQWSADRTRRTVTEADLFDVSIVCYPAYSAGTSVQARSAVPVGARVGFYPLTKGDWRARHTVALAQLDKLVAADKQWLAEESKREAADREIQRWLEED